MKYLFRFLLSIVIFIVPWYSVYSQSTFEVTGRLTDLLEGEILVGATILAEGTSSGTVTDVEGAYKLSLEPGNYNLVFSYVGYEPTTIPVSGQVGDQLIVNAELSPDLEMLHDVVVVGYGEAKKEDIAGAISSVGTEEFNKGVITSPQQMLQGKVSGVRISSNSGEPGAGMNISIRGLNSLRNSSQPLFIVDGIPLSGNASSGVGIAGFGSRPAQNPLNFLNPEDIKSVQVLKDASSTAIYGTRGANGVVIIETNKGVSEQSNIQYSNYFSVSSLANKLDVLSGDQFRSNLSQVGGTAGTVLSETANTDWQDEIFRTAYAQNHNLSFQSGTEKTSFNGSVGVLDQQGIITGNEFKKYNAKLGVQSKFLDDKLNLGFNMIYAHIDNQGVPVSSGGTGSSLLTETLRANPTVDNVDTWQPATGYNPKQFLDIFSDQSSTDQVLASLKLDFKILEGLNVTSQASVDRSNGFRAVRLERFNTRETTTLEKRGLLSQSRKTNSNFLLDNYLTYNSSLGKLGYKLMLGHSYQLFQDNSSNVTFFNQIDESIIWFDFDIIDYNYQSGYYANANPEAWGGNVNRNSINSLVSRLNLNWDDRYLLESSIRRDDSDRFIGDRSIGLFSSAAFRWKIHNESFFSPSFVDNLSLRASWGQTGNQDIPLYSNIPEYTIATAVDGDGNRGVTQVLGNEFLKWETTTQTNLGLDVSLFDKRVYGNVDVFRKVTKDVLLNGSVSLVPELGRRFGYNVWYNSPVELQTTGAEFLIGGYPISKRNVTWDLSANFTSYQTVIENLPLGKVPTGRLGGSGLTGVQVNQWENGRELSFLTHRFVRFEDDGTAVFLDANGQEVNNPNLEDKQVVASTNPDFTFGINSTLYVGNWDIALSLNGAVGLKLFNNTDASTLTVASYEGGRNTRQQYLDRGETPVVNSALRSSDYYLEDADYIRLNNCQVGYTFSPENISWLTSCRLYFAGQNLLTLTKYSGFDPEVNSFSSGGNYASAGIDYASYPRSRTLTLGLNITF